MTHQTFDFHFAARLDDTGEVVRISAPVDIPVIDAKLYATVDLSPGWMHEGGLDIPYHAHGGKFYSWPKKARLSPDDLAAILRWDVEPVGGIDGHPLKALTPGEAHLYPLHEFFFPPDWTETFRYGNPKTFFHAARAAIYGGSTLRTTDDVPPQRLERPRMITAFDAMPKKAQELIDAVRAAFRAHFAFIDGKLAKTIIEPLIMVRTTGGSNSAVYVEVLSDRWAHGEKPVRAIYPLNELDKARAAADHLATRFGGRVNDRASFIVHAPEEGRISSWFETWNQVRHALPKIALKQAIALPDLAILAAIDMTALGRQTRRQATANSEQVEFLKWIIHWRRFQDQIGDWKGAKHLGNTALKKLYLLNEFTRCVLDPTEAVPRHALSRISLPTGQAGHVLEMTREFLPNANDEFARAWLDLRLTTSEDEARAAARTMLTSLVDFPNDAARKRWTDTVHKIVRAFAGVTPEPTAMERANESFRKASALMMDDAPSPKTSPDALQDHFDRQFNRVMFNALEKGWPLDQVNAALQRSIDSRTAQDDGD